MSDVWVVFYGYHCDESEQYIEVFASREAAKLFRDKLLMQELADWAFISWKTVR